MMMRDRHCWGNRWSLVGLVCNVVRSCQLLRYRKTGSTSVGSVCEVIRGRLDLRGRTLLGKLTLEKSPSNNTGLPTGMELVRGFGFVNGRERFTRTCRNSRKEKKPTAIFRVQDHFGQNLKVSLSTTESMILNEYIHRIGTPL